MSLVIDEAITVLEGLELTENELATIAIKILEAQGCIVKIWDADSVRARVETMLPVPTDVDAIVEHVVHGDDWEDLANTTGEEDSLIYEMIEGTRNDHPEWFGSE